MNKKNKQKSQRKQRDLGDLLVTIRKMHVDLGPRFDAVKWLRKNR